MEETMWGDEEIWRCRKHPSRPRSGVCPACLRDRLLRLCPACGADRPCGCCGASTSSNSSSSSSTSADLAGSGIGAVGRVASLIENEPAFRRSRSTALNFLRPRPEVERAAAKPRGIASIWPFARSSAVREEERAEAKAAAAAAAAARMSRSRSVGVERYPGIGSGGAAADARMKGWNWHFPSPIKAFRHRKSSAKVVLERSPMCRG